MNRRPFSLSLLATALAAGLCAAPAVWAQGKGEVKIALIASKTGPL